MVKKFVALIADRRNVDGGACIVSFKPEIDGFYFIPGQYIRVILNDKKGANMNHDFSIASPPRPDDVIEIAFRPSRSAFKKQLARLPVGSDVLIDGPLGFFTLPEKPDRPIVFIAGGIGITPARSMILHDEARASRGCGMRLIYANRSEQTAPFLDELREVALTHSAFSLREHYGAINEEAVAKNANGIISPLFYVAGPPPMVAATHAILLALGIPESDMRMEEFTGYGEDC